MQSLTHRKNLISDGSNEPEDHAGAVGSGPAGMFWVGCFPGSETHPDRWQAAPAVHAFTGGWLPFSTSSGLWDTAVPRLPSVLAGPRVPSPATRRLNALRNRKSSVQGSRESLVTRGERLPCEPDVTDGGRQKKTQLPMTILPGDISTETPAPESSVRFKEQGLPMSQWQMECFCI